MAHNGANDVINYEERRGSSPGGGGQPVRHVHHPVPHLHRAESILPIMAYLEEIAETR